MNSCTLFVTLNTAEKVFNKQRCSSHMKQYTNIIHKRRFFYSRISLENKSDRWEAGFTRNVNVKSSHFDQQAFLKSNEKTGKVNRTQERQKIKCEKDSHILRTEISKSRQDKNIYEFFLWASLRTPLHLQPLMRPFRECLMTT